MGGTRSVGGTTGVGGTSDVGETIGMGGISGVGGTIGVGGTTGVKATKRTFLSLNVPRTLRGQEHVPKFLDVEMKMKEKNVCVQHEEKCWEVKVKCAPSGEYDRFTCGWSVFARQSQLQAGDVCVFEIIDPKVPLLKANIFKSISI
ncbi:hypothetical protein RJT34_07469 [Clitoria ternatea]|uniref:TF-B3 domain-containing protein n=1 Tax=Clitoria ternatea TaxID=43366 RepID=A0AAN9K3C9_CLITE